MKKYLFVLLCLLLAFGLCACGGAEYPKSDDFSVDIPADEILTAVKDGGWVVTENSRVSTGEEIMHAFYDACMRGESGSVSIAAYYTLDPERVSAELYAQEKDSYPRIFLTELSFDGEEYRVVTRCSIEAEPETDARYPYLLHLEGDAPVPYALYDRYDRYVLAENAEVTMEKIDREILSSVLLPDGGIGRYDIVYSNLIGEGGRNRP